MNKFGRLILVLLIAAVGTLAMAHPAQAVETCHKINAKGKGQITSQTATGATTVSQIIGGGLLHGTTEAELVFTSFDPVNGVATFEGPFVLTTRHGTLTLFVFNGVFNLVTGEFSSDSIVQEGTGRFAEASGGLFLHGFTAPDGSFIDGEISGTICLN